MTRTEIKAALAGDYRIVFSGYEAMERQAHQALQTGKMDDYSSFKQKASYRSAVLTGMKRAAAVLGIGEIEFMEAVNADR